jgi:hypothetical protein
LLKFNIFLTQVSGERLWELNQPLPPQVQIAVNVNVQKIEERDGKIEAPFVFTVNYNPSVAQITLKGKSEILGDKKELNTILANYKNKKPPLQIVQAVSSSSMAEAIIISKVIGVPPPLPSLSAPQQMKKTEHTGYTM